MRLVRVATCSLNQWAMDFHGNKERIIDSIIKAKAEECKFRIGPELEICGYSCEDHFLETDTVDHSWEVLADILERTKDDLSDILCDIGMPVLHHGVLYNCRVFIANGKVILVRPKLFLADDGNYREGRYFSRWERIRETEQLTLPEVIKNVACDNQEQVPIGDGVVGAEGILFGSETCEELFTPLSPHIGMSLAGVDVIGNGSGSHHQLRKLNRRIQLLTSATATGGGVYLYSNQQGCDGNRMYFDGCAMIAVNGKIVKQGSQFSLNDVEVVTATVDIDQVRSHRAYSKSRGVQAAAQQPYPCFDSDLSVLIENPWDKPVSEELEKWHEYKPEEEIALGPACWLWDYLRRSRLQGFFLPLSGGADSASTAAIVGCMCQLIVYFCSPTNSNSQSHSTCHFNTDILLNQRRLASKQVIEDVRNVLKEEPDPSQPKIHVVDNAGHKTTIDGGYVPKNARELAGRLFHTAFLKTSNSSEQTEKRAADLAGEIGSFHRSINIDDGIVAIEGIFKTATKGKEPRFKSEGSDVDDREDLAKQNIQARLRMLVSYMMAQLGNWADGKAGTLLVLGSANVDESLYGYLTKYDCSAADLNPIGGISKLDLRKFLSWGAENLGYQTLESVAKAQPVAELRPIQDGKEYANTDEDDMQMTYEELQDYGRLRKVERLGPVSMFQKLVSMWKEKRQLTVEQIRTKVERFFRMYSINRHKTTVLTPSYHAENYSPDDNRFDLRQFLYNTRWTWQFNKMKELTRKNENGKRKAGELSNQPAAKKRTP